MTEPNSIDHWASLAGNLGAEPVPEKPQPTPDASEEPSSEAERPAQAAPLPIFKPAGKPVRQERRPSRPAAWDQLAGDLGIELPPQPVAPEPTAPQPVEARLPSPPAPLPEEEERFEPAEIAAEIEAELTAWDDLDPTATEPRAFEPQEALDVMDETADEFEEELSGEAAPAGEAPPREDEERRGRRRRRRGRGRGAPAERVGEGAEGAETRFVEPGEAERSEEQSAEEAAGVDDFGAGLEIEPAAAEGEPLEDDRGERRRDRRRGRGPDREQRREATFGEEETAGAEPPEFGDEDEDEAVHAGEDEADDFEDDDGGDSPRIGFRNIPTWHDAIGVMIDKNMESRARNPSGPRGPGGRGPGGRGRGGRGRGRGRPERRSDRR